MPRCTLCSLYNQGQYGLIFGPVGDVGSLACDVQVLVQGRVKPSPPTLTRKSPGLTRLQVLYRRLRSLKKNLNSVQHGKRPREEVTELH